MFNRKMKKFFRDPNLYMRDFFAKRVKSPAAVINSSLPDNRHVTAQGSAVPPVHYIGLPYSEGQSPWLQLARQFGLRTGATNGGHNQSLLVHAVDLTDVLIYAMFLAVRARSGIRFFTLGRAVNRWIELDTLVGPGRSVALAELYEELRGKPDFCMEILGEIPQAFVAHVFLYDIAPGDIHILRSDRAFLRRATRKAFEETYPEASADSAALSFETPRPIDLVYTWVNRDDPDWQAKWTATFPNRQIASDRYASKDELRYSLRSVCKFMPWFRRIYIVSNCAPPDWLAKDDRICWIDHAEIFPDTEVLPNFNSHSIEASLHNIRGLSEYFIYFNDDFFVTQPAYPEDFFDEIGRSVARLEPYGSVALDNHFDKTREYLAPSINGFRLLRSQFPSYRATRLHTHTPYALRLSTLLEIEQVIAKELAETRGHKVRSPKDINLTSFYYHHYALATGQAVNRSDSSLIVRPKNIVTLLNRKLVENYKFLCFNDGDGSADDQTYLANFASVMANHFAVPCALERQP